ncbi:hypothetical protein [Salinispora arenicola]|nr:hypothetical protein [Salinispora arenicola]
MAARTSYSVSHLSNVEAGRRAATPTLCSPTRGYSGRVR